MLATRQTLDIMGRPVLLSQIRDSLAELKAEPAEAHTKDEILATLRS